MTGDFHFLRPWWLIAIVPVFALWWVLRRRYDGGRNWQAVIAPHLLPYLMTKKEGGSQTWPIDALLVGWLIAAVAISGPTWKREPTPFADDVAAVAIVVEVTPSMTTADVEPTRLARGLEKIEDLLTLRPGAKTSLIAYSGTAHIVMPTTTDGGIITTFAQALDPKIMPHDGDVAADAFRLADQTLADAGGGSILWIADSVAPESVGALTKWRGQSSTPVRLLPPLLPGTEFDALESASKSVDATTIQLTPDNADVTQIARAAKFADATSSDPNARWQEAGYWLSPVVALFSLAFFPAWVDGPDSCPLEKPAYEAHH